MTTARSLIVVEGVEAFYHCISRCVRRAFLCGRDDYTGRSFEHRKEWVRSRLRVLSEAFALDICAFSIMSNQLHFILRTRPDLVKALSDEEAARRRLSIFPKSKDSSGETRVPDKREIRILARDKSITPELKRRLSSVSWFMRCLNEYIAAGPTRRTNARAASGKTASSANPCWTRPLSWPAWRMSILIRYGRVSPIHLKKVNSSAFMKELPPLKPGPGRNCALNNPIGKHQSSLNC